VKKLVLILSILTIVACIVAGLVTGCESLSGDSGGTQPTPGEGVTVTVPETTPGATPGTTPSVDMTPVGGTQANFGQALDFGGLVIRVETPSEDSQATPREGNRAWAALVTIQNNRSAEVIYTPLDYHFVDGQGNSYEATGASMLPMLSQGLLAPGAQVQAYILMDLPSSTTPAQIRFEPYIPSAEKWVGIWQ
jgi:uncharacterized protein affecting Mg2+/Co2+ transport